MEQRTNTIEEFDALAQSFARRCMPHEGRATLVTLSGELGAGKTTFVQAVARAFGVSEGVTSPTFVLLKSYSLVGMPFHTLAHIDAYRLSTGSELAPLQFDLLLQDEKTLIMLEWPEKVADALPKADTAIALSLLPEGGRLISYG